MQGHIFSSIAELCSAIFHNCMLVCMEVLQMNQGGESFTFVLPIAFSFFNCVFKTFGGAVEFVP